MIHKHEVYQWIAFRQEELERNAKYGSSLKERNSHQFLKRANWYFNVLAGMFKN